MGCTINEEEGPCWKGEKPVHKVSVSDFWMGETEVTQGLWREVTGLTFSQQCDKFGPVMLLNGKGNAYPVYYVNWEEAVAFCEKLNNMLSDQLPNGYKFALPTEAEWEYAARGGKRQQDTLYAGRTHSDYRGVPRVKSGYPNDLGLYDMSGSPNDRAAHAGFRVALVRR